MLSLIFMEKNELIPLAERMRPQNLEEYMGQSQIVGEGKFLSALLQGENIKNFPSLILWGPPGTGKTSLARILSKVSLFNFVSLSAVSSGVKEIRSIIESSKKLLESSETKTLLFIDEIHRFNKSQQDAFLQALEAGWIVLIGATTENPSFEINKALLSRTKVLKLEKLSENNLKSLIERALNDKERGLAKTPFQLEEKALDLICQIADGDARKALNTLENASLLAKQHKKHEISAENLKESLQNRVALYDKSADMHYDLISALHKSIRNSNPQSALYYLARMIEAGEDPKYLIRRIIRIAYEDIGLADPQAALHCLAAKDCIDFLGYPECDLALAQSVIYLCTAPKSNRVYEAMSKARQLAKNYPNEEIPLHLRNSPTSLMKEFGYGNNYAYDHDFPQNIGPMESMPEKLRGHQPYKAGDLGFEKEIAKRLSYIEKIRKSNKGQST